MDSMEFVIGADDPCLDGHFPGDPLVPAVVILEAVTAIAAEHSGSPVQAIERCKFLRPLRAGEVCKVSVNASDAHVARFECHDGQGAMLAAGRLRMGRARDAG